jgi:hypothetical protein
MGPEHFFCRNFDRVLDGLRRHLDGLGPDYPECHVRLIDALRDYIRANEQIRDDLLRDDTIAEQLREGNERLASCRALLKDIEDFEFNPTLCGIIRGNQR